MRQNEKTFSNIIFREGIIAFLNNNRAVAMQAEYNISLSHVNWENLIWCYPYMIDSSARDVAPREFNGPSIRVRKGLTLIYTGGGKGKSTAAFGAVFRSLGRGLRVAVVQFIKGKWVSGEVKALEKFAPQIDYFSVGEGFTWETKDLKRDKANAQKGWKICMNLLKESRHDLFVFDEILYVLKYRFLPISLVKKAIKSKPTSSHLILTGREAPQDLIQMADLVTEMKEIKHPYKRGITAQPGIDY